MKQNLDEKITKLFYKLLNMVPTNIKNRSLIYNVEDEQISITWCVKREKDKSDSSCVEYNIVPFNRAECKYNFAFFLPAICGI